MNDKDSKSENLNEINTDKIIEDKIPENTNTGMADDVFENKITGIAGGVTEKTVTGSTASFEIPEKLLQDPRLGEAFIKRANSEICRLGMFFGVKIGLYSCACMLLVGYVMCIINHAHNALPLQTAFFCLFLPPVLNFFRKRADAKDPFVLETLKRRQKYSIEKYRIYNLTYFVIITGLALWLKVLFGTEGDILYIPAFSILAAVAGRILATAGYIIITKIRLSRGKVTK